MSVCHNINVTYTLKPAVGTQLHKAATCFSPETSVSKEHMQLASSTVE